MSTSPPLCRTATVFAFRGDRARPFVTQFLQALDDEKNLRGPGPTSLNCLLYAGHAGISVDSGLTIFGFNPDGSGMPIWQLMDGLKKGDAFPGIVRDDSQVFAAARQRPLPVVSFDIILPDPQFQKFKQTLDAERRTSNYSYGLPDGDGDCNCTTWLERLGLPC